MITNQQRVMVVRPGTKTDHGNTVPDWDHCERFDIRAVVQPAWGQEQLANRDAVQTMWTLYAPVDADVQATDRIELTDGTYEVLGQPQVWHGPSALDHLQATLQRWEG